MNTISKIMMAAGCGAMVWASGALATPTGVTALDSFDGANQSGTWQVPGSPYSDSVGVDPNAPFGPLSITVNNASTPLGPTEGFGYVVTYNLEFVGDYSLLNANISLKFTAPHASDLGTLQLYFHTVGGSAEGFTYDLMPQALADGQITYTATFGPTGWFDWSTGKYGQDVLETANFLLALSNIDAIGLNLANQNLVSTTYSLDEFKITVSANNNNPVPEPETVWMMIAVLASLAVTFRGRIKDVLGAIKA